MENPKAVIQKSGRGRLREAPAVVISVGEILVLWIDGNKKSQRGDAAATRLCCKRIHPIKEISHFLFKTFEK